MSTRETSVQRTSKTTELPSGESVAVSFIHEETDGGISGPPIVCSSVYEIIVDNQLNDKAFKSLFVSHEEARELKKILGSFGL